MNNKQKSFAAVIFALFATGLGQIYCGRIKRGLLFAVADFSIYLIFRHDIPACFPSSNIAVYLFQATIPASWVIYIASVVDAYAISKNANHMNLKRIWIWPMYILIVIGFWGSSVFIYNHAGTALITVNTNKFAPKFKKQDVLLINRFAYLRNSPKIGDYVLVKSTTTPNTYLIKKIIAAPDDSFDFDGTNVRINGNLTAKQPKCSNTIACGNSYSCGFRISKGEYIALEDHNITNCDSLSIVHISESSIRGKIEAIMASKWKYKLI